MAMLLDVAGEPATHVAVEVITIDTASLLANAVVVYVALLVPTLAPLSFHW